MYFPYLRGKQEEVFAIREVADRLSAKKVVFPVLEPVKDQVNQIIETSRILCDKGVPHALIENPRVGAFSQRHPDVASRIIAPVCTFGPVARPALLIDSRSTDAEVVAFLARYPDRPTVLIHRTSFRNAAVLQGVIAAAGNVEYNLFTVPGTNGAYRSVFTGAGRVILSDVFVRQDRNADYAAYDPEPFTTEHQNYAADGMAGFSDYATVGDFWSEGGGPAHAVTLHVTYPEDGGAVWIRHFVSDDTDSPADREGKTLQAISKAVAFAQTSGAMLNFSTAVPEWRSAVNTGNAPSLGMLKRQALRHHLELMDSLL